MKRFIGLIGIMLVVLPGCTALQSDQTEKVEEAEHQKIPDRAKPERPPYQPAQEKLMDLVHTKLEIQPNWEETTLNGKATLAFTPHFQAQDTLVLDAQSFDLKKVALVKGRNHFKLSYDYDGKKLGIALPRPVKPEDTITLFIDYTATFESPDETDESVAGGRGMYFINPQGEIEGKPRQIWTQGETEYSSYWFPTLDQPNVKTTQEIFITVDTQFRTLSNGKKVYSTLNKGGTRTDYWRQEKPHPPYLFMVAIGDFAVVKDEWRSKPVNYYVEPEYKPYAQLIFGKTPEMMSLFSELLGYEYPWAKYSQVAVRDFIAGAMENTSATIHFSNIQHDRRGHLDEKYETLIAHELIHHWFGNLVTCESWANLALNEAFATYGEHLWQEHEYGDFAASKEWQEDKKRYLREFDQKQKPLIQFRYDKPKALFDAHRYQKGALILHMLRRYLGDEAFFTGVQQYLENREYQAAEYHHLRLALEDVSGEDLNWFFNQWFRSAGHPQLSIRSRYDTPKQQVVYTVEQTQDQEQYPTFRLPVTVDIYTDNQVKSESIWLESRIDTFRFDVPGPPEVINFDADRTLLAEKSFDKSLSEWHYQYQNAPRYLDQYEAVQAINKKLGKWNEEKQVHFIMDLLNSKYWAIRKEGLNVLSYIFDQNIKRRLRDKIMKMASEDNHSGVRAKAFQVLGDGFKANEALLTLYQNGLRDSSYQVVKKAITYLANLDKDMALEQAKFLKQTRNDRLLLTVAEVYAAYGPKSENDYLRDLLMNKPDWQERFEFLGPYLDFLNRHKETFLEENLEGIQDLEAQIANHKDRKTVIKTLRSLKRTKQKALKKLRQSEGESDLADDRAYTEKSNVIDQLDKLIKHFKQHS